MKVIFAKSSRPIPLLIRLFTWSRWHHCAAIMEDGKTVIEASGGKGVIETKLADFVKRYRDWEIAEIDCVDDTAAYEFLRSKLGDGYDIKVIFGIFFRTAWDGRDNWSCSELVAAATGRFREERVSRVTPEHLWMMSK